MEAPGHLVREIPARGDDGTSSLPLVNYKTTVITGDRRGAGTSANVSVTIYGDNGDTGDRDLEPKNSFSRYSTEEFGIEAVDLGPIQRIKIGHDNKGLFAGWFLDKVILTNERTGEVLYFLSGQWFDTKEGDGQIVRELFPAPENAITYKPLVSYTLDVITGDRRGAGTDANVTATIYGEFGDSGLLKL